MRWFLPNTGFELGDRDWSTNAEFSIIEDVANARSGRWVGRLIPLDGFAQGMLPAVAVRPGSIINANVWVKGGTAGSGVVRADWIDASGAIFATANGVSVAFGGGSYAQSTAVFTAPDRAKAVELGGAATGTASGTWYVDDLDASGDVIETIPAAASLQDYRVVPADTISAFNPLAGETKFSEFNAGMSDRWGGVYTFTPEARGGDLNALLAFLRRVGRRERFFAYDPDRQTPVNGVVNGMVCDGGANGGNTRIPVRGGPPSTKALVSGDYAEVRAQYFQLQRDLEIGPEGTGEMIVWPSVRASIVDGEDVITDHPKMVARITSSLEWMRSAGSLTAPSISWVEF